MAKLSKSQVGLIIGAGLLTGAVVLVSWLKRQAKKLYEGYSTDFKSIKFNVVSLNRLNFDLFIDFTNTSDLTIKLVEQEYDVYIDGLYLTRVINRSENVIRPNQTSTLGMNVDENPKELLSRLSMSPTAALGITPESQVEIVMRLKVRIGLFSIWLPKYTYRSKLKNL